MDTTCSRCPSVISGGPPLLFCLESKTARATAVWKAVFVRRSCGTYYWRPTISNLSSIPLEALYLLRLHILLRADVVEDLWCATFVIVFQFTEQVVPYGLTCIVIELFVAEGQMDAGHECFVELSYPVRREEQDALKIVQGTEKHLG